MLSWSKCIIATMVMGQSYAHMKMIKPPARNSPELKKLFNLPWTFSVDYDIKAPLGMGIAGVGPRPFPCIARKKGIISAKYVAGNYAEIEIGGTADHNGGHCQISISYDEKVFVSIGNIYNDCSTAGNRKFKIKIPENAPDGDAVLAWTWISRTGLTGEFFMNCADVNIEGKKNGYIVGHDILVRKILPGPTYFEIPKDKNSAYFHENFGKNYGVENYSVTPIYNITRTTSKVLKNYYIETLRYFSVDKTLAISYFTEERPSRKEIVNKPNDPEKKVYSQHNNYNENKFTPPRLNNIINRPEPCSHGEMLCVGLYKFSTCVYGNIVIRDVAPRTQCELFNGSILLVHHKN